MAELGVIAEIEILSAEAETASRQAEILEARALLENSRDELYSTINLGAENGGSGLSGTQIIYRDNDPFTGDVIGLIPGAVADAFKSALEFNYKNWSLYLSLDIPLNSFFSRGAYIAATLER